jgi:peptidoglycan/xylan/chitin deacetylase (PgdA/CDA1 family)
VFETLLSSCTILQSPPCSNKPGEIVLTFDDGPTQNSAKLLDVLNEHKVKATFCYIGKNIIKNPQIVKKAYAEGHTIANHTYSHYRPIFSPSKLDREILETDALIATAIQNPDFHTTLFRPPYGLITPAVFCSQEVSKRKTAYLTFFFDDSFASASNYQGVIGRIKKGILKHNGGAIVLHEMRYPSTSPSKDWLPEAVAELIAWARTHNMTFTTYKLAQQGAAANP